MGYLAQNAWIYLSEISYVLVLRPRYLSAILTEVNQLAKLLKQFQVGPRSLQLIAKHI